MGYKSFQSFEILTADDVNSYLMNQSIMTFASTSAATTALGTPTAGMTIFATDTNTYWSYVGSTWVSIATMGAWTSYTPTLSGITIGNGTLSAAYMLIGKTVHVRFKFTLGTTSAITGGVSFSMPFTALAGQTHFGSGWMTAGGGVYVASIGNGTTTSTIYATNAAGTYASITGLSATIPATWASTQYMSVSYTYEAA